MPDVVEIARRRRSRLAAEIARLNDFIRTAEFLLQYEEHVDLGIASAGNHSAPIPPRSDLDAAAIGSGRKTPESGGVTVDDGRRAETFEHRPRSADSGEAKASPEGDALADAAEPSDTDPDHFHFTAQTPSDEEELVLTDRLSDDNVLADAEVGQKIRQRRWMMGMTKKQLANRLGISIEEMQRYERGDTHIGTGHMWHLAAALEVPMSYFNETIAGQRRDREQITGANRSYEEAPQPSRETVLAKTA